MEIRQGDAFTLAVTLTDETGTALTPDDVSKVEISIGNVTKQYPDEVTYDDGAFLMPITETDSHSMRGILPIHLHLYCLRRCRYSGNNRRR